MPLLLALTVGTGRAQDPPQVVQFAARSTDGGILVTWRAEEIEEIMGFRVLRSESADSGFVPLTPGILPAEPEGSFLDHQVRVVATVYYELEAIDRSGRSWRTEPVSMARSMAPHTVLTAEQVSSGGSVVRVIWMSSLSLDHIAFTVLGRSEHELLPIAGEVVSIAGGAMLLDYAAPPGVSVAYALQATGPGGATELVGTVAVQTVPRFGLGSAWPVPWQVAAQPLTIPFSLAEPAHVRLHIADVAGREIQVIADDALPAGDHEVRWNGQGERGPVPSGVFFYWLESEGSRAAGKLVVTR
jgi:hypothetical protein